MSGGSSRSTQTQQTQQVDNRTVQGEGAVLARDGSSIAQTTYTLSLDGGAIDRAFDTSDKALSSALTFGQQALQFSDKNTNRVLDTLRTTQQLTADAYNDAKGRGALTDKILIGAIGAVCIVAALAVTSD